MSRIPNYISKFCRSFFKKKPKTSCDSSLCSDSITTSGPQKKSLGTEHQPRLFMGCFPLPQKKSKTAKLKKDTENPLKFSPTASLSTQKSSSTKTDVALLGEKSFSRSSSQATLESAEQTCISDEEKDESVSESIPESVPNQALKRTLSSPSLEREEVLPASYDVNSSDKKSQFYSNELAEKSSLLSPTASPLTQKSSSTKTDVALPGEKLLASQDSIGNLLSELSIQTSEDSYHLDLLFKEEEVPLPSQDSIGNLSSELSIQASEDSYHLDLLFKEEEVPLASHDGNSLEKENRTYLDKFTEKSIAAETQVNANKEEKETVSQVTPENVLSDETAHASDMGLTTMKQALHDISLRIKSIINEAAPGRELHVVQENKFFKVHQLLEELKQYQDDLSRSKDTNTEYKKLLEQYEIQENDVTFYLEKISENLVYSHISIIQNYEELIVESNVSQFDNKEDYANYLKELCAKIEKIQTLASNTLSRLSEKGYGEHLGSERVNKGYSAVVETLKNKIEIAENTHSIEEKPLSFDR